MRSGVQPEAVYEFLRERLAKEFLHLPRLHSLFNGRTPRRIADVGCGRGYWLEYYTRVLPAGSRCYGVDPDIGRLKLARERVPGAFVAVGSGEALPWPDHAFDLVSQFVVFSSVIKTQQRKEIASEILRVLKANGIILWYDFFVPNPINPRTAPVNRRDIVRLFPDCRITLRRVTLAAPLARLCLAVDRRLAEAAERVPFLRTHYLAVIERNGGGAS